MAKQKKKNKTAIKDFFGNNVLPGDNVLVLVKEYTYGGIKKAAIHKGIYVGRKPGGKEFKCKDSTYGFDFEVRIQNPQCILINEELAAVKKDVDAEHEEKEEQERRVRERWTQNL